MENDTETGDRGITRVGNSKVVPISDETQEDIPSSELLVPDNGALRIIYNNCNGLQPTALLKNKLQQQLIKKRKDI